MKALNLLLYISLLLTSIYSKDLFEDYYQRALKIMSKMTIEEKVGQLLFPRYSDLKPKEDIPKYKPGGIIFYPEDFDTDETTIKNAIKEMDALSQKNIGIPLGLAVNEEGGNNNVVSIKHRSSGAFPSVKSIYKESGIEGILKIEEEKRNLLKNFNLNINLAPVADISKASKDYIYNRTLGRNFIITSDYIRKNVENYVKDGFSCCVKHFPGYGDNKETTVDASIDNKKFETLYREGIIPFINAINKEVPMIFFAHIIATCKDSNYPVSLSKTWHDYIRKDLSFSGLILTEIYMKNIDKYTKGKSPAVVAINAGNDIILTNDFYTHYNDVIKAIKNGDIKEDTINKACKRIISWKLRYLDFESNNINKTVEKKLGKNSAIDGDDIKIINRYYKKTSSTKKLVAVLVSVFVALGIFAIVFIICIYKKKKQPAVENAQDSLNKFPINNK